MMCVPLLLSLEGTSSSLTGLGAELVLLVRGLTRKALVLSLWSLGKCSYLLLESQHARAVHTCLIAIDEPSTTFAKPNWHSFNV